MPLWTNYAVATVATAMAGQYIIDTIVRLQILPYNHSFIYFLRFLRAYCMVVFLFFALLSKSFPYLSQRIVGKNIKTGRVAWWSLLLFSPFHALNHFYSALVHIFRYYVRGVEVMSHVYGEAHATQIFQGGMFSSWKESTIFADGQKKEWDVVVDLTCETIEMTSVRSENYYCIAIFDATPIPIEDLEGAVEFVMRKTNKLTDKKRILIRCAHGIGRSTMTTVAVLIRAGVASNITEALGLIKRSRPIVHLNWRMKEGLKMWELEYGGLTISASTKSSTDGGNIKR